MPAHVSSRFLFCMLCCQVNELIIGHRAYGSNVLMMRFASPLCNAVMLKRWKLPGGLVLLLSLLLPSPSKQQSCRRLKQLKCCNFSAHFSDYRSCHTEQTESDKYLHIDVSISPRWDNPRAKKYRKKQTAKPSSPPKSQAQLQQKLEQMIINFHAH